MAHSHPNRGKAERCSGVLYKRRRWHLDGKQAAFDFKLRGLLKLFNRSCHLFSVITLPRLLGLRNDLTGQKSHTHNWSTGNDQISERKTNRFRLLRCEYPRVTGYVGHLFTTLFFLVKMAAPVVASRAGSVNSVGNSPTATPNNPK